MTADATTLPGTDEFALQWMKQRIEDMSDQHPMWSRYAYTHRRTSHVAFCDGAVAVEGVPSAPGRGSVADMVEATILAVRAYRAQIDGPANLVWRCEPEVRRDGDAVRVYCRLCFEPAL